MYEVKIRHGINLGKKVLHHNIIIEHIFDQYAFNQRKLHHEGNLLSKLFLGSVYIQGSDARVYIRILHTTDNL